MGSELERTGSLREKRETQKLEKTKKKKGKKVKLISLLFHMGAMVSGDHVTPPTITSLVGLFSLSLNGSCLKILFVKIELGGGSVGEVQS